ncbi:MAG: hypothetical protein IID07_13580 [Gemmatimonadetes bacterium]|nr:hypothetical protein [Gemmatimonadota bacterium]
MGRLPPPKVIERPVLVRWGEQDAYPGSLIAELKAQPNPKLVLHIRGLGKLWAGAITETAELGKHLKDEAQSSGRVIGFSWPRYSSSREAQPATTSTAAG